MTSPSSSVCPSVLTFTAPKYGHRKLASSVRSGSCSAVVAAPAAVAMVVVAFTSRNGVVRRSLVGVASIKDHVARSDPVLRAIVNSRIRE